MKICHNRMLYGKMLVRTERSFMGNWKGEEAAGIEVRDELEIGVWW